MDVFLSHINEDAQVAAVLAQWIESSLDHDVHLSGEPEDVHLDEQRPAEVEGALGAARVVLLLCSDRSIARPWISFESGCAWLKRVPVIAACHSGCSTADQPPPLGGFPAFDLTEAASCHALLETLAGHLKKKRIPRIDVDQMVTELAAALDSGRAPETAGGAAHQVAASAAAPPAAAPESIESRLLAAIRGHPDFTWTATDLAVELGVAEIEVRRALDKLVYNDLLVKRASTLPTDPETRYACTDMGRSYVALPAR